MNFNSQKHHLHFMKNERKTNVNHIVRLKPLTSSHAMNRLMAKTFPNRRQDKTNIPKLLIASILMENDDSIECLAVSLRSDLMWKSCQKFQFCFCFFRLEYFFRSIQIPWTCCLVLNNRPISHAKRLTPRNGSPNKCDSEEMAQIPFHPISPSGFG